MNIFLERNNVKVKFFAPRQIQRRLFAALVTLSRKVFRPWHECFQIFFLYTPISTNSLRQLCQQMLLVVIDIQAICPGSLRNAVDDCACFGSAHRIDRHPVLTPNRESPQSTLAGQVINRYLSIRQEHFQVFFLIQAIVNAF